MKKVLSVLIIMSLFLSNFISAYADEEQYIFDVSDTTIKYTKDGTVTVSVKNNAGFASFILEIEYDTDFLELLSSEKSVGTDAAYNDGNVIINDSAAGRVKVVFASQENVTQDISLIDLSFKAIKVPEDNGDTVIRLSVPFLDDDEWDNEDLTECAVSENGVINIRALKDIRITNDGKTEYIENQELDLSKISVDAIYSNGSELRLSDDEYEIFDYSTPLKIGEVPKLKYSEDDIEIVKEIGITVRAKKVCGIRVNSENVKKEYIEDQAFVTDGLIVYKIYDNGEEEQLEEGQYAVDKKDALLSTADENVTVSYIEGQTFYDSIHIIVSAKKLVSIYLDNIPPKNIYKAGEAFDIGNMKVYGKYNNEKDYELTEYSIEGFDGTFGDKNVYVLCDNIKSREIPIKVVIPGDVTYNGIIQPNDATAVMQHIAGLIVLEDYRQVAADVRGEGIDPNDAVAILRYCAGYNTELK